MPRLAAVVAAALALSAAPAIAHPPGVCLPTERCETWSAVYDDPAVAADRESQQFARVVLANETTVFTVLRSVAYATDWRTSTATANVVAYDLATGAVRWTVREQQGVFDVPEDAALSPDGTTLYVTMTAYDAYPSSSTDRQLVTVAYATATGARLWSATWNERPAAGDYADGIAVAPDGSEVYVVGSTPAATRGVEYVTVAYSAGGQELWSRTFGAPDARAEPRDVAVSPDGSVLAVTGSLIEYQGLGDVATVAYSLRGSRGQQRWAAIYDSVGTGLPDHSNAIVTDGDRFYVTGGSYTGATGYQYTTLAYGARTGALEWAARRSADPEAFDTAVDLAVGNGRVVVTGQAWGESGDEEFDTVTVGYDAATGAEVWSARFAPARHDGYPAEVALSPDGGTAYVVMREAAYLTVGLPPRLGLVAYDVATGAERWRTFLDAPGGSLAAVGLAVSGDAVAVAGDYDDPTTDYYDVLTAVFH